ncbi:hypothetical protein [Helicobacter sp. 11S03491-1]|uniref:hypothetical protein n=1 Tax=Helicobacter sp. 11S03491-1 TaxID=1476196 RepID=UPI000BA6E3C6|nr:hypothetical protein [Helicobacter sp. 11S03491-1]PAF42310.1 hypothetical protein BKH45_05045 [Helicobacter sp. 11S03491-1]
MKIKTILLAGIALLFVSCARYNVIPENIARYDKGVEILESGHPDSKVQIEISQNTLGGLKNPPLVIYIGAQILQGPDIILDTHNLSATQNGSKLMILTYREILNSNYDFTSILQDFGIPTPGVSSNTNIMAPIFYFGRGGFLVYNMFLNPFIIDNIQSQQTFQEQREARKIMATNYLRKSTLSVVGKAKGGFIVISPKGIKPGTIKLEVLITKQPHIFNIDIRKR